MHDHSRTKPEYKRLDRLPAVESQSSSSANTGSCRSEVMASIEEALHAIEPALALRTMPRPALGQRLLELLQDVALLIGQLDRRLDLHVHIQIARDAGAQTLDALAAQTERLARLRAFRHRETCTASERRDFDLATERGRGKRNRHLAMEVVAVTLEHRMLLDMDFDVQVAAWAPIDARFAVARRTNPHAVVDTGRDLHFQRLRFLHLAGAMAMATGFGDVGAGAVALRASLLDAEKSLRHPHGTLPVTGWARFGLRSGLRARALANVAIHPAWHPDLGVVAVRRLFQRDFHAVAQVGAAINLRAAASTARAVRGATGRLAEDVAEDIAECIGETAKTLRARAGHVRIDTRMAVLVVSRAFLRVRQHFVGFLRLLEMLFRVLAVWIAVGVKLHRQLAICLLDFVVARVLRDAQNVVVIPFRHIGSAPPRVVGPAAPSWMPGVL